MRILMAVPHTLPAPDGGHGCPVMSWAMLKWLKENGNDVSLFAFAPAAAAREPNRAGARGHLKALGVPLFETSPYRPDRLLSAWESRFQTIRKTAFPQAGDFMTDSASFQSEWGRVVEQVRPDAFWLYTTDAVALTDGTFPEIPRLASLVDLDHEARELKRSMRPASLRNKVLSTIERLQDRELPNVVTKMLKGCDVVIEHSIVATEWLRQRGVDAHYLPNPVESETMPQDWRATREKFLAQSPVKRILMVGHLRGVATRTGIRLLADETLPALSRKSDLGNWEVHIVGGGELPPKLHARLAANPRVKLRGFVEDLVTEYHRSHLTLVAVSEKIGFRTRLVEAFAYASPCVVHSNNLYGMPELENGHNSLLANTGEGLAEAIAQVIKNDNLRRDLETNAIQTYDKKLSIPVVMGKMYSMLESEVTKSDRKIPFVPSSQSPVAGQLAN
jgi:glycosyltransferase involved in cell wall biosynthesis